jgi:hypothetical protein
LERHRAFADRQGLALALVDGVRYGAVHIHRVSCGRAGDKLPRTWNKNRKTEVGILIYFLKDILSFGTARLCNPRHSNACLARFTTRTL